MSDKKLSPARQARRDDLYHVLENGGGDAIKKKMEEVFDEKFEHHFYESFQKALSNSSKSFEKALITAFTNFGLHGNKESIQEDFNFIRKMRERNEKNKDVVWRTVITRAMNLIITLLAVGAVVYFTNQVGS